MSFSPDQISEQLKYSQSLKPKALPAKISRRTFFPESSTTFSTTSSRVIRIPIASDGFMNTNNSWFRCTLSYTQPATAAAVYLRSGYSLFQRLRILSTQGTVLSEFENYGQVINALCDAYLPSTTRSSQGSAAGFATSAETPFTAFNFANMLTFGGAAAATVTHNLTIPLIGTHLLSTSAGDHNGGHGTHLPLGLMAGLVVELTLRDDLNNIFISSSAVSLQANAANFSIQNVCYDAEIIQYSPEVVQALKQGAMAAGGKLYLSGTDYHSQVVSSSSQRPQLMINERCRSLRSLYVINQLVGQVGVANVDFDARVNLGNADAEFNNAAFYILIASQQYPPQQVLFEPSDHMAELAAAGGKPLCGLINRQSFISQAGAATSYAGDGSTSSGMALYGLNLDTESAASMLEAGVDLSTNSIPITVSLAFQSSLTTPRNHTIVTQYDSVIVLDIATRDVQVSY